MIDLIKKAKKYVIYLAIIITGMFTCDLLGQRILDIFGSDRWEEQGPGTNSNSHK